MTFPQFLTGQTHITVADFDRMAQREGVSLNQYLVSTLSHAVGIKEAEKSKRRTRSSKK